MSPSITSAARPRRCVATWACCIWAVLGPLLVLVQACQARPAGETCWSDWECQSSSCSWGTCDSDAAALLGFLAEVLLRTGRGEWDDPLSAADGQQSSCAGLDAAQCSITAGCRLIEYCLEPLDCEWEPDAGYACAACVYAGCASPCRQVPYCY